MLNELEPNLPPERPSRIPSGIGAPEIAFGAGAILVAIGLALVYIPAAILAVGIGLMIIAWRAA
jgi:hypothetical protein